LYGVPGTTNNLIQSLDAVAELVQALACKARYAGSTPARISTTYMTPQQYLEHRLKECTHYEPSTKDLDEIKRNGLKDFLFRQITRKKFRRWKLPDLARERILRALDLCISGKKPILFRFRFGGYKLWRLASAPEVDWAEFFTLAYYSEYLAPVIALHEPGVKLLFMSDDVFVERLDNIPKADTEAYYQSFQKLCDTFNDHAPKNFSMEMKRHSSLFNSMEELNREFDAKMKEIEGTWREKQSPEKLKSSLATSALNINWHGVRDLTALSDNEKQKMIERSAIMHDALVQLPTIRAFSDKNPEMVFIFTTPLPTVVSIGTTKTSITRFWVGTGVLEKRNDNYFDRILSPNQVERLKNNVDQEEKINLVSLKNFSSIKIFNQQLDFVNKNSLQS
jgi:hypothetical protein